MHMSAVMLLITVHFTHLPHLLSLIHLTHLLWRIVRRGLGILVVHRIRCPEPDDYGDGAPNHRAIHRR
jgi:hypothetical protein